MRSPKSKHQGRYQWNEIQSFARELADRKKSDEPSSSADGQLTSCRASREERLRGDHALIERGQAAKVKSVEQAVNRVGELRYDLAQFKASWSENYHQRAVGKVERHEADPSPHLVRRDLESGDLITVKGDTTADQSSEDLNSRSEMTQSIAPNRSDEVKSEPNPWEQLRDHFIQLREHRLKQEAAQAEERNPSSAKVSETDS